MVLKRWFYRVDLWAATLAGLSIGIMILHICLDVVGKYLFNAPIQGTIAIVINYYMPIIVFLPLAFAQVKDQHISVEVITANFPRAVQYHLYSWTYLVSAAVFTLLAWTTWIEALNKFALGTFEFEQGTRIETWPGYFMPPLGYGLIAILLMGQFCRYVWTTFINRAANAANQARD